MTPTEPLRRKSEWRYDHLPRLAIYQDDVQALVDLFSGRFETIDLTAADYKLRDVASLRQLGTKPLHRFSIRGNGLGGGFGDWASVTIAPMYVQIVVSDDQNVELLGLASAAREILMRRVHRVAGAVIYAAPAVAMTVLVIGTILSATVAAGLGIDRGQRLGLILIPLAIAVLVFAIAGRLRLRSHGTLYPYPSTSTESWWDRNRDAVVTQLLAALLGGLALLALELALGVLHLPGPATAP